MGKIITIVGSPGAGKTMTAVKLAAGIEKAGSAVAVVLLDINCAPADYITADSGGRTSIGALFSAPDASQDAVLAAGGKVAGHTKLLVYGYDPGECYNIYPALLPEKAQNVLEQIRSVSEYVIIDCISSFELDAASGAAIMAADVILSLGTADAKGVNYHKSIGHFLDNPGFAPDGRIRAVGNCWPGQDAAYVSEAFGGAVITIPHCAEAARQCDEGRLFDPLSGRAAFAFCAAIDSLIELVASELLEAFDAKAKKAAAKAAAKAEKTAVAPKTKAPQGINQPKARTAAAMTAAPQRKRGLLFAGKGEF